MRLASGQHDEAAGIVRARLGRPPQDVLEAAVVLEAWGGMPAFTALRLAAGAVPRDARSDPSRSRWTPARDGRREGIVAEGLALLMAILAIAAWAGPLSRQLGATVLAHALVVALPLTLALQWTIRSRYLSRPGGLRCVAEDRVPLCLVAVAIGAPLALAPGFGPVAAMLVAIWVGGTLLTRRGWGMAHGALLVAEAVGLAAGLPAMATLGVLTLVTLLAVVIAVATAGAATLEPPGEVGAALAAGAVGALLGVLLVGDRSLGWGVHGAFPALALVPSVIGSFWGGYHLWQLHDEIPRRLAGVSPADANGSMPESPAAAIVRGAVERLVASTVVLSALVIAAGHWTSGHDSLSLFVAFGCAALACLAVSLLESLGYAWWGLGSAAGGVAVELAVSRWTGAHVPGAGLIAGGAIAAALALAPLVGLLRSPGRVLATALWIR